MNVRRIVTGHGPDGKSIFVSDGAPARTTHFKHTPGFINTLLWETKPGAAVPAVAGDPSATAASFVPAPGGANVMVVTFPPNSVAMAQSFDPVAAGEEFARELPGLAEKFEIDNPGMHTTDTVDYGVLLDGEILLELDDGQIRKLFPRDIVIQNGTRHAWRNKSDQPATMLFVLIGAVRR